MLLIVVRILGPALAATITATTLTRSLRGHLTVIVIDDAQSAPPLTADAESATIFNNP